jgi:hypothetical protein
LYSRTKLLAATGVAALAVAVVLFMSAGGEQTPPPTLTNMHSGNLAAYWQEVAQFAEIDPENGRLHDWRVTYDENGEVLRQRLTFVTGGETDKTTWYTLNQSRNHQTSFDNRIPKGPSPKDTISGVAFFRELDAVGLRRLEEHSGVKHPAYLALNTVYGSIKYGENTYVLDGGKIAPPGLDGITMVGGQGRLLISHVDYSGSLNTYVIPKAVAHGR